MGKQAREERREAERTAAAEFEARRRRERRNMGIGVGALVVVVVVGIVGGVHFLGAKSSLPAGTRVFAETNHTHVLGTLHYDHVPPAGGAHNGVPLNCGIYNQPVPNEHAVHSLEHGAVWITYRPDLASSTVTNLQLLVQSNYVGSQRYIVLSPYPGLPSPIVASAWGAQVQLQQASDPRLIQFIQHYAGGGQGGELGGPCTGGFGTPVG